MNKEERKNRVRFCAEKIFTSYVSPNLLYYENNWDGDRQEQIRDLAAKSINIAEMFVEELEMHEDFSKDESEEQTS